MASDVNSRTQTTRTTSLEHNNFQYSRVIDFEKKSLNLVRKRKQLHVVTLSVILLCKTSNCLEIVSLIGFHVVVKLSITKYDIISMLRKKRKYLLTVHVPYKHVINQLDTQMLQGNYNSHCNLNALIETLTQGRLNRIGRPWLTDLLSPTCLE